MSGPAEPSRKRARLQDDPVSPSAHSDTVAYSDLTRDGEFWLGDGSVVLIAGKTGFKVYRDLLAAQSPIFADMFATATPSAHDALEGCPVAHVSDSAEDIRHFLRALLPKKKRSFFQKSDDVVFTIDELSSVVRLSHKYQVEDLQSQALSALQMYFTDSFAQWDTVESDYPFDPPEATAGIEVVHLATLTDTPGMLPVAMYTCATGGSSILDGWCREDGTVVHLNKEDLGRVIDGFGSLQRGSVAMNRTIFHPMPSGSCLTPISCRSIMTTMRTNLTERTNDSDLLHHWRHVIDQHDICKPCSKMLKARDTAERRRLWKELPSIFRLTIDEWSDAV
ncbi:hypothetical protein K466DRAFT_544302 [Polyporus arcularius HHB13444]|uniref:BTB domain-containing protein n=1 Tax=Polyporus arcularius HHB13444 TaxID=1314778 RepID=A0A5C3PUW8_9APHY|nr:hypothetical protein K466DRAFT_544302 [Polyporus arcularius HHB13444]